MKVEELEGSSVKRSSVTSDIQEGGSGKRKTEASSWAGMCVGTGRTGRGKR